MECFERAYSESDKEKKDEERLRVKVGALEGMGKVYSFTGKYEGALDCFGKGLNLLLGENGVEGDPLVGEVSEEMRWRAISDPRVYLFYAHKAMAFKNLAVERGEDGSGVFVEKFRKLVDELLKGIPMTVPHMEVSRQLSVVRYDLMVALARRRSPEEFFEEEGGDRVLFSVDIVEKTYQELGYTEAQIAGDFEVMGITRARASEVNKN